MSRDPITKRGRKPKPPKRDPATYSAEEAAERLAYSAIPQHRSEKSAAERIEELFSVSISAATIARDTEAGRIVMNLIAGRRHYSDRSLFDYVVLDSNTSVQRIA